MYAADHRKKFVRKFLRPYFKEVVSQRPFISLPTKEQMQEGLQGVLEDMA